ncbi:hypothetical protein [Burkholderia pyrrocinia]|uniref:glycine-rich domain-containing protein n=1 Tax=Burkholderia pyrrocinia TaxID=60550 RepID=UPI001FC80499|nr:hypothetical protein [Burkholderia pyrrocinia]
MSIQNDFLPFATGPGANVVDQTTYAALAALTTGFVSGTSQSIQVNKVWRQSSIMSAVIAQFIVAQTGQAAVDDGTTATLLSNFTKAVNAASKQRVILTDTGSANALAAANAVPMTALPTVSGVVQTVTVKVANTGASTYSPDGLASAPIFGLGGSALQGGEMVANGIATLVSYVGPLLNGGALCWVLFECVGGAQQVAPATQQKHAMQLGQATGRLINVQRFTASGTYTRTSGANSVIVEVIGGGGAGGGSAATTSTQMSAGGGGGSGAYAKAQIPAVPASVSVTVGAGGTASAGVSGGSGGASSFGSYVSAGGGNGGQSSVAGTAALFGGPGGGSTSISFGSGSAAIAQGQGGGGDYSTVLSAAAASAVGGKGGASYFGGGGNAPGGGISGNPSSSFGGGGSGSANGGTAGALAGGTGATGIVIVYEFA